MKKTLIAITALGLISPALAQTTGTAAAPKAATTPKTLPQAADPADTATDTSEPPAGSAQSSTAPAASSDPKTIIATEFSTYDKDSNGSLSAAEFDAWMLALKQKLGATPMEPAEQTSWLKGAFASADKDKSKSVSLAELTSYLTAAG